MHSARIKEFLEQTLKVTDTRGYGSKKFLNSVLDAIPDGISVLDKDLRIIRVNRTMDEWYSHNKPLKGKRCFEVYHQRKDKCEVCPVERAWVSGNIESDEITVRREDGTVSYRELYAFPMFDNAGRPTGVIEYVRDITQRRLAEDSLRESETRFRMLADLAPVAFVISDKDQKTVYLSRGFTEMFGYTYNDVPSVNEWMMLAYPDQKVRDKVVREWAEVVARAKEQGAGGRPLEYPVTCKDGKVKYTEFRLSRSGGLNYIVFADITERKETEKELRLKSLVLDQIIDNVTVTDLNGIITYVNNAETQLLKRSAEDLIGKPTLIYGEDPVRGATQREIAEKTLSEGSWSGEVVNYSSDGEEVILHCRTRVVHDEYGTPVALCGIATNITEQKKQNEAVKAMNSRLIDLAEELRKSNRILEAERNRAERSDQIKSAFLANMSHEIRTPLNAIVGFASMLKMPEKSQDQIEKYSGIIMDSGNHLLNIINDIIDISKIDAGLVKVEKSMLDLRKFFDDLHIMFSTQINDTGEKDLKLINSGLDGNISVFTDETRLRQIMINLLGNSVKFTEDGFIEYGCSKEGDKLLFYVKDSGIGIPAEKLDSIFERFVQVADTDERFYGGTGLGLSIAKACAGLLGGEIWVKSEPGKGSEFYFTIDHTQ